MMKPSVRILLCVLLASTTLVKAAEAKPNIVFILADDLGWADAN